MNQKGFTPIGLIVTIAGILVIILLGMAVWSGMQGQPITLPIQLQAGGQQIITPAGDGQITISGSSQNPSLVVSAFDQKTLSSLEATVEVWKDNGDGTRQFISSNTTSSGSVTFSNLDPNTHYFLEVKERTSGTYVFYPKVVDATTLNAGSKTITVPLISVASGVPTYSIYNNDDVTANSTSASLALGANDTKSARVRVRPASTATDNNYFGGGVIPIVCVFDHNALQITQVTGKLGDTSLSTTGVPSGHSVADLNHSSSIAFALPVSSMKPATDYDLRLSVKSASGVVFPVHDGNGASIFGTCYDGCRIKNTNTGEYVNAYRNPVDLTNICATNYGTITVYIDNAG